ncbi:uncharacterized protein LOC142881212 isoform X2 [Nelusetta ayraudi]|uniref:uncharacterized protein LOC142881212 isoform X2 n=1 Tax=Nelusetta ayraudi TaxID=303726 RepID=UPI003F7215A4
MSHQDFPGDPLGTGSRKTAYHYRRGSSGASAPSAATVGDDNPTQAGSSSPGLHHHQQQPPQSQVSGAQVKKKSGFQITSVTSAQINVSGNNSLADDTESYDDMDESHTEDLSSDMLDVSVSRAAEAGVPERSSSDETLNSLHGVDTPGLVSPNEPIQPHGSMVNGTVPHQQQQQHQYYPQQQHGHHHSNSLGGGEPPLSTPPPQASSSPALASKAGTGQTQRPSALDNTKPAAGTNLPPAGELHPAASGNVTNAVAGAALPATAFDNASAPSGGGSGPVSAAPAPAAAAAAAAPAAPNTQTHHTQTQAATGSRFRVVKLDTNSEPFRKGRWTCTEFYEKEVPPAAAAVTEPSKGGEVLAPAMAAAQESEAAPAIQPPHTLQPYQQPSQDFTSPQAVQSPPQPAAAAPLTSYAAPQEAGGGLHLQKPVVAPLQPLPYAVDPHQAQQQQQGGYAVPPQLYAGVLAAGGGRQPDFIQPTAPFQTQVQPPLPLLTKGMSIAPVPGLTGVTAGQPPQLLPPRVQGAPPTQVAYPAQPAQPQPQLPAAAPPPAGPSALHGAPPMPLTAVLQPLLAPGAAFAPASGRTSQLEDAQKLLLHHQGLLSLPRFGMAAGGEGAVAAGVAAASLAHMGMSAEATAFMAAAAAGLRSQHGEGEEDRKPNSGLQAPLLCAGEHCVPSLPSLNVCTRCSSAAPTCPQVSLLMLWRRLRDLSSAWR